MFARCYNSYKFCNKLKSLILKSHFEKSQLCCLEMDLYSELIKKNTEIMHNSEKNGKLNEAIRYCENIMKLKQKLHGNGEKYSTQYEELIKIGDLFYKLNDFNNAIMYFHKSILFLNKDNTKSLQEVYYKLAKTEQERQNYNEACVFFQNSLEYFRKSIESGCEYEHFSIFFEAAIELLNTLRKSQGNQKNSEIQKNMENLANEFIRRNRDLENDKKNNMNRMIMKINES